MSRLRLISRPILALALLAGLALAGCSSTRLVDTWKDPAFTAGPPKQLLVLGISRSDANRRIFEDGFVGALKAAGTPGAPSYPVLTVGDKLSTKDLADAMDKTNSDAVLVTRVLRVKRDVNVSPGFAHTGFYGRGFGGWYGGAYAAAPDVNVYDVLTLESTLWNIRTDKPVWSATSEVTDPGSVGKATEELAKVLVTKMKADGVI
ncbi:hypothetical protein DSM104443_02714 [Usitatibacter rugosus]|uniref:DUF4136 domain-containing protein n=1 Tax=Usitatibacter rugosus TaxID=2732067 RepID=A0A6M4GXC0_9PROT|nr:hypothetical protein [Usitatibacter rugosus]QJR11635.1 hypothetical protein DSM104443_02714 [Usitatibacter rugosus]